MFWLDFLNAWLMRELSSIAITTQNFNEIDASQFLNHTSSSPKPTSLVENTYGDRKNFLLLPVNYLTIPIRFFESLLHYNVHLVALILIQS